MQRIGVGIIGFCGHAYLAQEGWDALADIGIDIDLVGVASLDRDSIPEARFAAHRHADFIFSSWQALVDSAAVDVVVVDGPYHLHAEMSAYALAAGKHVFCEKLVALTWDQLAMLEAAAEKSDAHFWSMTALRYDPSFHSALQLVKDKAIGKVCSIQAQKSYKLGTRPEWYGDRALYGGTIPWVGSHALDLIYALAGPAITVDAVHSQCAEGYEMAALVQCRHEQDVLSSVTMDFYRPASASSHSDDRIRIVGEAGIIEAAHDSLTLIDAQGERSLDVQAPAFEIFADGIQSLVRKTVPTVTAADAFALARLCLAARDSADANAKKIKLLKE